MSEREVRIVDEWFCGTSDAVARSTMQGDPADRLGSGVVQVAQCEVQGRAVLVMHASFPPATPEHQRALTAVLRGKFAEGAVLALVLDSALGRLAVDPQLPASDPGVLDAVAAAAVVKAAWGWDESPRIEVELLPSGPSVGVRPRVEAGRWTATLERAPSAGGND